jgi:hypothetical protein
LRQAAAEAAVVEEEEKEAAREQEREKVVGDGTAKIAVENVNGVRFY